MKLQHRTDVVAGPDEVWAFLQDTHAVVGCVPGAELLDELGDDRYQGVLRVAVGPLSMNYAGDITVVERDARAHRIVLDATGRDKRGSGAVAAHVQLQVQPTEAGSRIEVISDVDLSGRIASLGRGINDVSNRMFVDFATRLGARVQTEEGPTARTGVPVPAGATPRTAPDPRVSPVSAPNGAVTHQPMARDTEPNGHGEIQVLPFLWAITRERLATFLQKLSDRVRPH